jgi:hypothetical protein
LQTEELFIVVEYLNRKRKFLFLFATLTIVVVPFTIMLLVSGNYGFVVEPAGFYLFASYYLYLRYTRGVKTKYPLASPVKDIYFPRTNIPRPIYQDYREHPELFEDKKKRERKRV